MKRLPILLLLFALVPVCHSDTATFERDADNNIIWTSFHADNEKPGGGTLQGTLNADIRLDGRNYALFDEPRPQCGAGMEINELLEHSLPLKMRDEDQSWHAEPPSEGFLVMNCNGNSWSFPYTIGPLIPETTCSASMSPDTLTWTMGPHDTGATQTTSITVNCNQDTSLTITVAGLGYVTAKDCTILGEGVCMNWTWPDGRPSRAAPVVVSPIEFTPVTNGASPGEHGTWVAIYVNFD